VVARKCTLGVDTAFFTPDDRPREDYVLSVGAFAPAKGFRFLVRVLALVTEPRRPPLVLVADRELPGELAVLQGLAEAHGVRLTTRLRVSEEELRDLYRRARLFVYAPYLEPLGLAPLEAMACATPVLGVREGGVRETVIPGRTGDLAPHDPEAFAAALSRMLARPEDLARLGREARDEVCARWTWERSLQELLEAMDLALARYARRS